jgi:predicted XRE-type DNA-binding protein
MRSVLARLKRRDRPARHVKKLGLTQAEVAEAMGVSQQLRTAELLDHARSRQQRHQEPR